MKGVKTSEPDKTVRRKKFSAVFEWFGRTTLRLLGWQIVGDAPTGKNVIISAPHESYWDIVFLILTALAYRTPIVFLIKDTVFWGPFRVFWRWLGGIPINRRARTSTVDQVVQFFDDSDTLCLVMSPEGTRKNVRYWKTGFYWIAYRAGAGLIMATINYKRRSIEIPDPIELTGDLEADWVRIQAFYQENVGITPEYDPKSKSGEAPAGRKENAG